VSVCEREREREERESEKEKKNIGPRSERGNKMKDVISLYNFKKLFKI